MIYSKFYKNIFSSMLLVSFLIFGSNLYSSTHNKNQIKVGLTSAIDNFDPHWNQLMAYQNLIAQNVFDHLTVIDTNMEVKRSKRKAGKYRTTINNTYFL